MKSKGPCVNVLGWGMTCNRSTDANQRSLELVKTRVPYLGFSPWIPLGPQVIICLHPVPETVPGHVEVLAAV